MKKWARNTFKPSLNWYVTLGGFFIVTPPLIVLSCGDDVKTNLSDLEVVKSRLSQLKSTDLKGLEFLDLSFASGTAFDEKLLGIFYQNVNQDVTITFQKFASSPIVKYHIASKSQSNLVLDFEVEFSESLADQTAMDEVQIFISNYKSTTLSGLTFKSLQLDKNLITKDNAALTLGFDFSALPSAQALDIHASKIRNQIVLTYEVTWKQGFTFSRSFAVGLTSSDLDLNLALQAREVIKNYEHSTLVEAVFRDVLITNFASLESSKATLGIKNLSLPTLQGLIIELTKQVGFDVSYKISMPIGNPITFVTTFKDFPINAAESTLVQLLDDKSTTTLNSQVFYQNSLEKVPYSDPLVAQKLGLGLETLVLPTGVANLFISKRAQSSEVNYEIVLSSTNGTITTSYSTNTNASQQDHAALIDAKLAIEALSVTSVANFNSRLINASQKSKAEASTLLGITFGPTVVEDIKFSVLKLSGENSVSYTLSYGLWNTITFSVTFTKSTGDQTKAATLANLLQSVSSTLWSDIEFNELKFGSNSNYVAFNVDTLGLDPSDEDVNSIETMLREDDLVLTMFKTSSSNRVLYQVQGRGNLISPVNFEATFTSFRIELRVAIPALKTSKELPSFYSIALPETLLISALASETLGIDYASLKLSPCAQIYVQKSANSYILNYSIFENGQTSPLQVDYAPKN